MSSAIPGALQCTHWFMYKLSYLRVIIIYSEPRPYLFYRTSNVSNNPICKTKLPYSQKTCDGLYKLICSFSQLNNGSSTNRSKNLAPDCIFKNTKTWRIDFYLRLRKMSLSYKNKETWWLGCKISHSFHWIRSEDPLPFSPRELPRRLTLGAI